MELAAGSLYGLVMASKATVRPAPRPASRVQPQSRAYSEYRRLIPVMVLLYAALVPYEARAQIGGQALYLYRIVIIVLIPWIVTAFVHRRVNWGFIDALLFLAAFWMPASFIYTYGPVDGITRGGALALDTLGAYLIGRTCIRDSNDLRRVLILFAPGLCLAGLSVAAEAISHRQIVKPLAEAIFGSRANLEGIRDTAKIDIRLGLLRSAGPFPHPILAGVVLVSAMAIYLNSGLRKWPFYGGMAGGLLAVFTVSSSALFGLVIVCGATFYDRFHRLVSFLSWRLVLAGTAIVLLVLQLATSNGVIALLGRLTLDPQTAYYRRLTWHFAGEAVADNPVFGIGFEEFARPAWMSTSVDAHWLNLALKHGLPVPVALLVLAVTICFMLAQLAMARRHEVERRLYVGCIVSLGTISLLGFTVSFYGGPLIWYCALLGMLGSLAAQGFLQRQSIAAPARANRRAATRQPDRRALRP